MANDPATLSAELERLYQRQADLRAHEVDLAERGENDPASDEWKLASIAASKAEIDFCSALLRNYSTISRVLREAAEWWRPIPVTPEIIRYVSRYGGDCRDCADNTRFEPICSSGLPCDADKAIEHVLKVINYGFSHGFLKLPPPPAVEAPSFPPAPSEQEQHDRWETKMLAPQFPPPPATETTKTEEPRHD